MGRHHVDEVINNMLNDINFAKLEIYPNQSARKKSIN